MKTQLAFFASMIFCLQAHATTVKQPVRYPKGAAISPTTRNSEASGIQAKLACDLYEYEIQDGTLGKSRLLKRKESPVFQLGAFFLFGAQFPAPYEKVQVAFNHFLVSYGESAEPGNSPYIQAFYTAEGSATKDTHFNLKQLMASDKITVRDTYVFSDSVMLTYQCGIELL